MKVGFFLQGTNADYRAMARLSIDSVRQSMPDVEVHHLTDEATNEIQGVDGTRRFAGDMPMAVRRMLHHAACEGEWLFIDCDVIVKKDVRDVFEDRGFDVALTDRAGTITNEAKYAAVMPYNIGVTFSRSQDFWMNIAHHLKNIPLKFQEWEGDQRIVCEMVRQGRHPFRVKTLPGLVYNYPPRAADDPRIAQASIVHYKGARKAYLLKEAA
jgi:hypothetical protein